jgi:hypothetical protein
LSRVAPLPNRLEGNRGTRGRGWARVGAGGRAWARVGARGALDAGIARCLAGLAGLAGLDAAEDRRKKRPIPARAHRVPHWGRPGALVRGRTALRRGSWARWLAAVRLPPPCCPAARRSGRPAQGRVHGSRARDPPVPAPAEQEACVGLCRSCALAAGPYDALRSGRRTAPRAAGYSSPGSSPAAFWPMSVRPLRSRVMGAPTHGRAPRGALQLGGHLLPRVLTLSCQC